MELKTDKTTDRDRMTIQCPADNTAVERQYCQTFSFGRGCRDLKLCWND